MQSQFRHAAVALLLVAGTAPAGAQTVIVRDPVAPLQLTAAQRVTIYRTIIPQGRGRGPIVKERIVAEPIRPVPLVRERVIESVDAYAYGGYGPYYGNGNGYYGNGNGYAYANGSGSGYYGNGNGYYGNGYGYRDDYAYAAPRPPAPVGAYGDYAYAVGARVPATARLAPVPQAVVAAVPAVQSYSYIVFNGRVLLIDPVTSVVVADVTGY